MRNLLLWKIIYRVENRRHQVCKYIQDVDSGEYLQSYFPLAELCCFLIAGSGYASAHKSAAVHPSSQTYSSSKFSSTGEHTEDKQ